MKDTQFLPPLPPQMGRRQKFQVHFSSSFHCLIKLLALIIQYYKGFVPSLWKLQALIDVYPLHAHL